MIISYQTRPKTSSGHISQVNPSCHTGACDTPPEDRLAMVLNGQPVSIITTQLITYCNHAWHSNKHIEMDESLSLRNFLILIPTKFLRIKKTSAVSCHETMLTHVENFLTDLMVWPLLQWFHAMLGNPNLNTCVSDIPSFE